MGLGEQTASALHLTLERLQGRIGKAFQIAGLVHQGRGLVLQRLDLVVDLLERARGLDHVLDVIGRIVDGELGLGGAAQGEKAAVASM